MLDDAFQHRYVKPGLTILLIDYNRPIHLDRMLPAGRLREPESGKKRADIIIVSKCPAQLSEAEQLALRSEIAPLPCQQLYFTTLAYGKLQPLFTAEPEKRLEKIRKDEHILLVTGIASPAAIIDKLSAYTQFIMPLTFPDHHDFDATDVKRITEAFKKLPADRRFIVTTEKDAARLTTHPLLDETLKPSIYVLPVEVAFLNEEEHLFNQNIIEYVRKNSRNSSFSKS